MARPTKNIYLLDIDAYVDGVGVTTFHYSNYPYILSGVDYVPRLKDPGSITQSIFQSGKIGGACQIGYGTLALNNNDRGLDSLLNHGYSGRAFTLRRVNESGITTLMTGTQEQPVPTWKDFVIRIKDRIANLNVPIQTSKYAGSNTPPIGFEGDADIVGKVKPLLFGSCKNITPECVNKYLLIYEVNDHTTNGALNDISSVYDKRVPLTKGADYANSTLLQAAIPATGSYITCLAEGYFKLGSSPIGQITCDAVQGANAAARTMAQISKLIALRKLSSGDLTNADFTALDTANSAEVGLYINSDMTINEALDKIAEGGAWFSFDNLGKFHIKQMTLPSGTPDIILTDTIEPLQIERVPNNDPGRGVPIFRCTMGYDKNHTIQNKDSLAGNILNPFFRNVIASSNINCSDITFGNGLFVAVGSSGVLTSPDGVVWTSRSAPSTYIKVCYGNGMFVALSSSSTIAASSPDGIVWTARTLPVSAYTYTGLVYGNGKFVAVAAGKGYAIYSSDGVTWYASNALPSSSQWYGLAYNFDTGMYCTIADDTAGTTHYALTSTDAITWTQQTVSTTLSTTPVYRSITYGNGLFVAATNYSTLIATSPDGVNWTQRWGFPYMALSAMSFLNGVFIAVGQGRRLAMSIDGIIWNQYWPPSVYSTGVAYGNGSFVSMSTSSVNTLVGQIIPSNDLLKWLSTEYRTVKSEDLNVLTKYLDSQEITVTSPFVQQADTQTECGRVLNMLKSRRDMLDIVCKPRSISVVPTLGMCVQLNTDRFGYSPSKLFKLIGIKSEFATEKYTLTLWG